MYSLKVKSLNNINKLILFKSNINYIWMCSVNGAVLFRDLWRRYLYLTNSLNIDTFPPEKSTSCICLLPFPLGRQGRWLCLIRFSAFLAKKQIQIIVVHTGTEFKSRRLAVESSREKRASRGNLSQMMQVSCAFTCAVLNWSINACLIFQ